MIAAEGIVLEADGRRLLDGVSVTMRPGEVLAVVGPNGAGKSTLLHVLAGDLRPAAGRVALQGRALRDWTAGDLARCRAVMGQQAALAFDMAAEEVVALGRMPWQGLPPSARDAAAVRDALERAGVSDLARRIYATLSGGERQRVQLARALAQLDGAARPAALLLDEPTASLDVRHRAALLRTLRGLAGEGMAVLVVLHDLQETAACADRVLVLHDGRAVACGPVAEVLEPERLHAVYGLGFRRQADGSLAPDYSGALGR
ncbi:heme ABC transporter ATP-binding protein [Roseomonas sp. OT10]|uniref:heme ABC transporter ATP-binding protein n=1 Tax=Roseomonas cutis TaxID=2897332 RepID=UPI001E311B14|nr:heme ABC transporter ATP-binding protein [Roseomonas sp. OT10]UFN49913.1 heme ABC transporter ATP-binding protein [Roseomonas sp. OT10]